MFHLTSMHTPAVEYHTLIMLEFYPILWHVIGLQAVVSMEIEKIIQFRVESFILINKLGSVTHF